MTTHSPRVFTGLIAIVTGAIIFSASIPDVLAQEICERQLDNSGAQSKYTEQHVMEVGDVPGHEIRIFELHRTYTSDKPNCENLKRKESWTRGYSDYVNRNGRAWGYSVLTFENGDKIFSEFSGTSQTVVADDGEKKSNYVGVNKYTGGTGIYAGVRGMSWDNISFDPIANKNVAESKEEYRIEK